MEACPICEHELHLTRVRARDRLLSGEGPFGALECVLCRYAVTVPRMTEQQLRRYYPSEYYEQFYEHSAHARSGALHRLRERYRSWSAERRYQRAPFLLDGARLGRMLDVGCGSGELLEHFHGRGWETYGIDPSSSATEACRRRGAHTHQGTLNDQPWAAGFFDVIVFQHSLEHIVDPIDALRSARRLLAEGGLLIIAVPNWECWQRRLLFRDRWFHLDLPRHQQHFTVNALKMLAAKLDLRIRSTGTSSTAISCAYSLHYLLAGRWRPGWRLWLSYALGVVLLPLILLGDRIGGGDCCFIVMQT
jgi:SAM-dependent methyltransferase